MHERVVARSLTSVVIIIVILVFTVLLCSFYTSGEKQGERSSRAGES